MEIFIHANYYVLSRVYLRHNITTHLSIGCIVGCFCRLSSVVDVVVVVNLGLWSYFRPGARYRPDFNLWLASICYSRLTKKKKKEVNQHF